MVHAMFQFVKKEMVSSHTVDTDSADSVILSPAIKRTFPSEFTNIDAATPPAEPGQIK